MPRPLMTDPSGFVIIAAAGNRHRLPASVYHFRYTGQCLGMAQQVFGYHGLFIVLTTAEEDKIIVVRIKMIAKTDIIDIDLVTLLI